MSKYTFTCEYVGMTGQPDGSKITLEVQEESLRNVVEAFERFLKGAGFVYDGYLDFVDDTNDTDEYKESMHWPFLPEETTYGSHYNESEDEIQDLEQEVGKCSRCGLTREQLGDHKCYDNYCGMK